MTRPDPGPLALLASYAIVSDATIEAVPATTTLLIDSGAFTAYRTGREVTVEGYANYLARHADRIDAAITLDVIGGTAEQTDENTDRLRQRVPHVPILPVFHYGGDWDRLDRLCATNPYICLGGLTNVARQQRPVGAWFTKAHQIATRHGCRLHGLGMTRHPWPAMWPWYSVDSSFWNMACRNGSINLYNPATRQPHTVLAGKPMKAPADIRLVRTYGGDPVAVASPGFGRTGVRGDRARDERRWMMDATLRSMMTYAAAVRGWRPAVPGPHGMPDGLTTFFAIAGRVDIGIISEAHRLACAGKLARPYRRKETP